MFRQRSLPWGGPRTISRIFVLGNQKSGTTAIAELFGSAGRLRKSIDVRTYAVHEQLPKIKGGAGVFPNFVSNNEDIFASQVIKEASFTFFWDEVRKCFPDCQAIFVVRDPRENIRSILNRLGLPGNKQWLNDEEMSSIPNAWRTVVDNTWLGIEGGGYIEQLSRRWVRAVRVYLSEPNSFVLVRYEDFVADKKDTLRSIGRKLSLDVPDLEQLDLNRQFQSRGDRGIGWEAFFGVENLGRIEGICSDEMVKLGYKLTHQSYVAKEIGRCESANTK